MAARTFRTEEGIGLAVAIAAHVAIVAVLVLKPSYAPVFQPPERIEVTLSDNVGLTSTSPEPNADAMADVAPEIGEAPPQETQPEPPKPQPLATPSPQPVPRPVASAAPKPPQPSKPQPSKPQPATKPSPAPKSSPAPTAAKTATKTPPKTPAKPDTRTGGSRIGSDFLEGVRGAQSTGTSRNAPAAAIGPAVRSSLGGAISRQLKPKWAAPQGPEAEQLVTILAWDLNPDGSLDGRPRVVRQEGITDVNRAQAKRHAEQAIRAVELAAPFKLPSEYYSAWQRVSSFRFDKRLSQ